MSFNYNTIYIITPKMQVCRMCLSHNIHQQHALITVVIIISVKYKNIRIPSNISKCIMNHLLLRRMYKIFLYNR